MTGQHPLRRPPGRPEQAPPVTARYRAVARVHHRTPPLLARPASWSWPAASFGQVAAAARIGCGRPRRAALGRDDRPPGGWYGAGARRGTGRGRAGAAGPRRCRLRRRGAGGAPRRRAEGAWPTRESLVLVTAKPGLLHPVPAACSVLLHGATPVDHAQRVTEHALSGKGAGSATVLVRPSRKAVGHRSRWTAVPDRSCGRVCAWRRDTASRRRRTAPANSHCTTATVPARRGDATTPHFRRFRQIVTYLVGEGWSTGDCARPMVGVAVPRHAPRPFRLGSRPRCPHLARPETQASGETSIPVPHGGRTSCRRSPDSAWPS